VTDRARVLGTCYVCGRSVWGFMLRPGRPYATSTHTRYAVGDEKGVRHSTCYRPEPDDRSAAGVDRLDA
jgi:hypothetical protein